MRVIGPHLLSILLGAVKETAVFNKTKQLGKTGCKAL